MWQTWSSSVVVVVLALAAIATCVNSEQDDTMSDEVKKRSVDEDVMEAEAMGLANDVDDEDAMDKRSRLFRYGRGGLMRYGKRAPVFRYGKRAVFRYGKRSDDEAEDFSPDELEGVKRLFRWGKRSDLLQGDVKRLFRWGKRSGSFEDDEDALAEDEDVDKRAVFRYGKREAADTKRRVFRFGKRGGDYKYGRDTRVPDQPHVPFRFGEDE